ncbi:hypothetical protein NP233_g11981 [Leucocoprinus birnbaumii]|uniref:Zinc finger PHD-type domain-containing protein n=1 Tax=Leucocoprinus birnbaumii TaxID=56174 RepID=A0AAD5YQE4_9AGAR|nr:hypothetical protein NP233_g11981 [Leucocoprinus birnbaumii]
MIRKQPPAKPPPSLLSPLIHQLNMTIPVEFQLPEDIRTYFKDVGQGPKGNYIDTSVYKPPRQNRLGLFEDRDPYRLKDRNGAPVLCFQCGVSALPIGLAATAPASKRTRRSSVVKGASDDSWKPIVSCDFCNLHWHLDCLDPPLPSMPPYNKKWMCPNHSDKVLPIKRRVPKSNPYPVIEIDRQGQFNNGNIDIIPSETTTPVQQVNRIATDEVLINGRRYRVPERTIVLDFWSKLSKSNASSPQEEKDTISSAMSSPLTSLSSLDDFGDDPQETGSMEETDDLKIAEMLCNLRLGRLHTASSNGSSRRKTTERAVQTGSDIDPAIRSAGRSANPVTHAKRLAKAATVNGFARPQPSTSTDSTSTLGTSLSAVIATRRKRSTQSIQPENSTRELRSRSRNVGQEPSRDTATFTEGTPTDTTIAEAPIPIAPPARKAVHVKVEESDDSLALLNGNSTVNSPTTIITKTPSKRRGRKPAIKEAEEPKPAPAKRGRKRKEREEDPPYRPNNPEIFKKEKIDTEEKEKRVTRRRNARTPSRSRAPTTTTTAANPPSAPTTPSLKIRLPRFNAGSISMLAWLNPQPSDPFWMALRPLIAICGTTGVGKSNIAVELALRLRQGGFKHGWRGAKIINADSMQVYEGLDVITNKMPVEERQGVEHLLMDIKKPGEQYVVGQWVQDAIKLINEIHDNGEVPIVVGGTSYWIQHLVFSDRLIGSPAQTTSTTSTMAVKTPHKSPQDLQHLVSQITEQELVQLFITLPESPPSASSDADAAFKLHTLLNQIDPVMASRWHWRDTRKVLRSLEIIKETGRKASDIVAEQASRNAKFAAEYRFRTLFFWLYAEPSILEQRLYDRVDKMIELGLLDEIRSLRKIAAESSPDDTPTGYTAETNYSSHLAGYKEFHNYFSGSEVSQSEFTQAVDRMKLLTKQYAKRQISWIRNKLIPVAESANKEDVLTPFYLLDATELGKDWTTNVQEPAVRIMEGFLNDQELPEPKSLSERALAMLTVKEKDVRPTAVLEARRKIICPVCTLDETRPVMIEQGPDWEVHQNKRSHKRLQAKAIREAQASITTNT